MAVGWPRGIRDGCKGLVGRAPGRSWLFPWGSVRRPRVMPNLGTCQGFSSRFSSPQPTWDWSISTAAAFVGRPRGGTRWCGGRVDTAQAGVNVTAKPTRQPHPTGAPSRWLRAMPAAFQGQEQTEQGGVCTWVCMRVCTRAQRFEPCGQGHQLVQRWAEVWRCSGF